MRQLLAHQTIIGFDSVLEQEEIDDTISDALHSACRDAKQISTVWRLIILRKIPNMVFEHSGRVSKRDIFGFWIERVMKLTLTPNGPMVSWYAEEGGPRKGFQFLPRNPLCVRHVERFRLAITTVGQDELFISTHTAAEAAHWFFAIQEACLKSIVDNGASAETPDQEGHLPLHIAIRHANWEAANALVEAFPRSAEVPTPQELLPLHLCLSKCAPVTTVRLVLRSFPFAAAARDPDGFLPLHLCCRHHCWAAVPLLLELHKTASCVPCHGQLPLFLAWEAKAWQAMIELAQVSPQLLRIVLDQADHIMWESLEPAICRTLIENASPHPSQWTRSHIRLFVIGTGTGGHWGRLAAAGLVSDTQTFLKSVNRSAIENAGLPPRACDALVQALSTLFDQHGLLARDTVKQLPPDEQDDALSLLHILQTSFDDVERNRWRVLQCVWYGTLSLTVTATDQRRAEEVLVRVFRPLPNQTLSIAESEDLRFRTAQLSKATNSAVSPPLEPPYFHPSRKFCWVLFAMPLGVPLQDAVNLSDGAVSEHNAVGLALELLTIIESVHELGIAHCGISVDTISIIQEESNARKCVLFGLGPSPPRQSGPVDFTPFEKDRELCHMCPEWLQSDIASAVSVCTDMWGLSIVLFQLVCHRLPFRSLSQISNTEQSLFLKTDRISERLSEVLTVALSANAAHRYTSTAEMRRALEQVMVYHGQGKFDVFISLHCDSDVAFGKELFAAVQNSRVGPSRRFMKPHINRTHLRVRSTDCNAFALSKSTIHVLVISRSALELALGDPESPETALLLEEWAAVCESNEQSRTILPVLTTRAQTDIQALVALGDNERLNRAVLISDSGSSVSIRSILNNLLSTQFVSIDSTSSSEPSLPPVSIFDHNRRHPKRSHPHNSTSSSSLTRHNGHRPPTHTSTTPSPPFVSGASSTSASSSSASSSSHSASANLHAVSLRGVSPLVTSAGMVAHTQQHRVVGIVATDPPPLVLPPPRSPSLSPPAALHTNGIHSSQSPQPLGLSPSFPPGSGNPVPVTQLSPASTGSSPSSPMPVSTVAAFDIAGNVERVCRACCELVDASEWIAKCMAESKDDKPVDDSEMRIEIPPGSIGVKLSNKLPLMVLQILPKENGAPSSLEGIPLGSIITHINGEDISLLSIHEAKMKLHRRGANRCVLTIVKPTTPLVPENSDNKSSLSTRAVSALTKILTQPQPTISATADLVFTWPTFGEGPNDSAINRLKHSASESDRSPNDSRWAPPISQLFRARQTSSPARPSSERISDRDLKVSLAYLGQT